MSINPAQAQRRLLRGRDIIVALCADLEDADWRWRPAPGKWSLLEVVNHLADEERDDFRKRLDLLLHHAGTTWPPIDPQSWVEQRHYNDQDPQESLQRFRQERDDSLLWLGNLGAVDWLATYDHPSGPMRAGDLLLSWMIHDDLHARQMMRLHHDRCLATAAPFSAAYAGPW
jgi:uncharacterized damage-inducible protein DinB